MRVRMCVRVHVRMIVRERVRVRRCGANGTFQVLKTGYVCLSVCTCVCVCVILVHGGWVSYCT